LNLSSKPVKKEVITPPSHMWWR